MNNFYLLLIVFILFTYLLYEINCLKKEHFDASMDPNIKAAINAVYLADIEAIRNLSSIATKLVSNGGLTFTGNFDITGNSTISGNSNVNGNKTISGNLTANGTATIGGNLSVASNFTTNGTNFKVDQNGNTTIMGNLKMNTFYRKYSQAGHYQIKGYGRSITLNYGWTILDPVMLDQSETFHRISARLFAYEKNNNRNGRVTQSSNDLRAFGDNNWHPYQLVIFPEYCVRFFYWNKQNNTNDRFLTGEGKFYSLPSTQYDRPVSIIFVSLIEEESQQYIKNLDTNYVSGENLLLNAITNVFP